MDATTVAQRDQLEAELLERAAQVHAAQAALVEVLVRFDELDGWHGAGIKSVGHWGDINLGLRSRVGSRLTEVGRKLRSLPAVAAAFRDGSLSLDKVLLVAAVASPVTESMFLDLARTATVAQLARICSAYRDAMRDPDDTPEAHQERHGRRGVTFQSDDCGLVRVIAMLEPEDAALLQSAIDARVETAWRAEKDDPDLGPAPELSVRRADALVELATEGLVAGPDPVVRGSRCEVVIHVDADVLTGAREDGLLSIEGSPGALARSTFERLSCDCSLRPILDLFDGTVLDWGRSRRTPTAAQRRALRNRDKGCRFPGCGNSRFVDAHHVQHWTRGGRTDLDNLLLLCPAHHRLFHEGGYRIDRLGGQRFVFRRPDGRSIGPPPPVPAGVGPPARGRPRAAGGGGRLELEWVLDALVS